MREKVMILILMSFLVALIASVYSIAVSGGFVYDDYPFVVENPYIKSLYNTPEFFTSKFTVSRTGHYIYRPLRTLSFAIDYAVNRLNPVVYHAHNILLHCMNTLLLFWLVRRLYLSGASAAKTPNNITTASVFAFFTAVVWAFHPLQTEAVCWISSRGDLLAGLFLLLSLMSLYYSLNTKNFDKTFYSYSLLLAVCALLSKESAGVVALLVWLFMSYGFSDRRKLSYQRRALIAAPFFFVTLIVFYIRYMVIGSFAQAGFWGGSFISTVLAMFKVQKTYMILMLFPVNLHVTYDISVVRSFMDKEFLIAFFMIAAAATFLITAGRKNRVLAFGGFWYVINMIPVSNIAPIKGAMMTEHFLYLPVLLWAIIVTMLIFKVGDFIRQRQWGWARYVKEILMVAVLISYVVLTAVRCIDWRSEMSLWRKDFEINKDNPEVLLSLANAYHREGDTEKAEELYLKSIYIDPNHSESYINLADLYLARKDYEDAFVYANEAVAIGPQNADAHWCLGKVLAARDMTKEASASLERAIGLFPGGIGYYIDLGILYDKMGQLDKAVAIYNEALKINWQEPKIHNNLGIAYQKSGDWKKALYHWQEALRIDPSSTSALTNIRCFIIR